MKEYGGMAEMLEVESPHAEMHKVIKEIIQLREKGEMEAAEREFQKVKPLSFRIVSLLEKIEIKTASL